MNHEAGPQFIKPVPKRPKEVMLEAGKVIIHDAATEDTRQEENRETPFYSKEELLALISSDLNTREALAMMADEKRIPWEVLGDKRIFDDNPDLIEQMKDLANRYLASWRATDSKKMDRLDGCSNEFAQLVKNRFGEIEEKEAA